MPTRPTTIDQTKYREVQFVGGRILEARELQLFEDLERDVPAKGKYELGSLFDPGATLNVQVQIAAVSGGYSITLLPVNTAKPMMVFVRGAFEAFTAPVITFSAQSAGFVNQVFLNYVVWCVTPDGAGGTLTDLSLVDSVTGEQTAEMGQLQVYVGADDSGPIDNVTMFDRNTVPMPMFSLAWQTGGTLVLTASTRFGSQVQAGPLQAGVVKLSTGTSQTAVAADDPSVTNARTPLDASVTTSKVKPVLPATPATTVTFTNEKGTTDSSTLAAVGTGSTNGGIGSSALVYETWSTTVSAAIGLVWSKLVQAYGVLQGFNNRITALENTVPVNLASHIGKPLGPNVHPASSLTDYIANNCAYKVVDAAGTGAILGEIDATGNYQLLNSANQGAVTTTGGTCLKDYLSLAAAVVGILETPGVVIPAFPTFAGDVIGAATANSVVKLQGKPLSNTAPTEGQGLIFTDGTWAPGTLQGLSVAKVDVPVAAPSNGVGPATMTYFIFTFGKTRVAFGNSQLRGGHVVPVPTSDWNSAVLAGSWGIVQATVSLGVLQSGGYGVQTYLDQNMTVVVNVWNAGSMFSVLNAQALGTYVNVNVIAISQDA